MAAAEAEGQIRTERKGAVQWITLDRAERLNALAGDMRQRLEAVLLEAGGDPAVRAIVVTGAGRAFCAGADVEVMAELLRRDERDRFAALVEAGMRVVRAVRAAPQPVIAAVNGVAVGAGASLALACDLRIVSDAASIGLTFNRIGLHPDWGATHFLPALVGRGRAAELIHTARLVDAAEAQRIGLAERVVPSDAFAEAVDRLARELADKPPLALRHAKRSLEDRDALERALQRERDAQLACFDSADAREGIAAFLAKRPARFRGE